MYKSLVFGAAVDDEKLNWRIVRVRLFECGHSMQEIDSMGLQDIGDVVGYWSGKGKGEQRLAKAKR